MKGITGFRLRGTRAPDTKSAADLPAALRDPRAQDRVMTKIEAMGEAFYAMSEDEYGDWLDALPQDEFFEFLSVMYELDDRARAANAHAA
jgi:hypothetical protein